MSDNIEDNAKDSSYNEESMQDSSQNFSRDSPMSPPSSDEEDEELEEELMYYQIAMEAKAEIERIKTKVTDEFIFKKPLHPAPRAKNRSKLHKKTAVISTMVPLPLFQKKVLKKHRYYYIETKYTPLPPLVPISQKSKSPQCFPESFPITRSTLYTKQSKTYLFDPSKMPREKEDDVEKYYNPYIPTAGNNSNKWLNQKSKKTDYELYGDPFGPGTSKAWTNWTEDKTTNIISHNNFERPLSPPGAENFVSYGHYTQCHVEGCGCMFYYQAPDYSSKGGKKVFYIVESTDQNVNGKVMTLEEQRHYMYYHKDSFISMKELEWEYEPNNIVTITDDEPNASDYVEAVLGPVPNGSLYEPSEHNESLEGESLDREYYLFKYFEDIQSPSSSSDDD